MNILVFDTETTALNKPFCYNLGYVIYDTEKEAVLMKRDFVVEQVWHNLPLFATAYYADKRPLYVYSMRARRTTMNKYGYIQRQMARDIRDYDVQGAYAFNSPFDEKVFDFNSDYYHCANALDTIPVFDIRGYAINFLMNEDYCNFCNMHEEVKNATDRKFITDSDGYKTTAESFYCFLKNDVTFDEAHTALADSEIELAILVECLKRGAQLNKEYSTARSYPRLSPKHIVVKRGREILFDGHAIKFSTRKSRTGVTVTIG